MEKKTIDLNDFILENIVVLSGRIQGENIRKKLKMEDKDNDECTYTVIIPQRIRTLNPSYFLGLFSISIHNLGLENFMEKYTFISDNDTGKLKKSIEKDIKEGIEWALDESEILQ